MKALVIGYGSIGARHARILKEAGFLVTVVSSREVDFSPRVRTVAQALKNTRFDYAVVANRTADHFGALEELEEAGHRGVVLVEKPLYLKVQKKQFRFKKVLVAYNLRFHPLLAELKRRLKNEKIISMFCYVGKYLPNWHPDKDYRLRYSAIKKYGGGVLRDLSHELDYLMWLGGTWKGVAAVGGHWSHLRADSDDSFSLLFSTARCPAVCLQMNYLDRRSRRELIVNTDAHTFRVDLITGEFEIDQDEKRSFTVGRDDTYRAEHEAVKKKKFEALCSWREGMETLTLIEAAEKASKNKKWIFR